MVTEVVAEADLAVAEEIQGDIVVEVAVEVAVVDSAAALTVAVEAPAFVVVRLAGVLAGQSYSTKAFPLNSRRDSRTPVFLP